MNLLYSDILERLTLASRLYFTLICFAKVMCED